MKLLEIIFEVFGWLIIVASVTAGCALISLWIFITWPTHSVKILSLAITIIGFLGGVIWATRIWKKHGTIAWLSSIRRIS